MVAILGFTREQIFAAVQQMYSQVARSPSTVFHFPTGRNACLLVGYPAEWLDAFPASAIESFAGVGFPFRAECIRPGDRVLDVGAGSGTDTLAAARLVGPSGKVWALDMTPAMLEKLRCSARLAGASQVEPLEGNAEAIPLPDASVDVVTSNGVLNLVPDKRQAFAEIFRVLRPGGCVQIADVVVSRPAGERSKIDAKLWAECVVGASVEEDYLDLFRSVGFANVRVLRRFDYFAGSISPETRRIATALGARSIELAMERPAKPQSMAVRLAARANPLALVRRAIEHRFAGSAATAAALAACYGTLALAGALGAAGLAVPLNARIWAGAIVVFALLAPLALARGRRFHGAWGPSMVSAVGALLVVYAILIFYDWRAEAAGFLAMIGAAFWDQRLYRRAAGC